MPTEGISNINEVSIHRAKPCRPCRVEQPGDLGNTRDYRGFVEDCRDGNSAMEWCNNNGLGVVNEIL
jgi:hypothetical protein